MKKKYFLKIATFWIKDLSNEECKNLLSVTSSPLEIPAHLSKNERLKALHYNLAHTILHGKDPREAGLLRKTLEEQIKYTNPLYEASDAFEAHITPSMDTATLGIFSQVSRQSHQITQHELESRSAKKILHIMMQPEADFPRTKHMHYVKTGALKQVAITEPGKIGAREWEYISPLQFAAWIGDFHTLDKLIGSLDREEMQKALQQLEEVHNPGLQHGRFMAPYYNLIKVYEDFKSDFEKMNKEERDIFCTEQIGKLQDLLPQIGLKWLCTNYSAGIGVDGNNIGPSINEKTMQSAVNSLLISPPKSLPMDVVSLLELIGVTSYIFNGASQVELRQKAPECSFHHDGMISFLKAICDNRENALQERIETLKATINAAPDLGISP